MMRLRQTCRRPPLESQHGHPWSSLTSHVEPSLQSSVCSSDVECSHRHMPVGDGLGDGDGDVDTDADGDSVEENDGPQYLQCGCPVCRRGRLYHI